MGGALGWAGKADSARRDAEAQTNARGFPSASSAPRENGLCAGCGTTVAFVAAMILLGGILAVPTARATEAHRIFLTDGYRYEPAQPVQEATADTGLALCGTRCNALSTDFQSYMMTMGWRLIKVEGSTERVVDLGNPFLDGKCVCSGQEYRAEFYYHLPGGPPAPGGKE